MLVVRDRYIHEIRLSVLTLDFLPGAEDGYD